MLLLLLLRLLLLSRRLLNLRRTGDPWHTPAGIRARLFFFFVAEDLDMSLPYKVVNFRFLLERLRTGEAPAPGCVGFGRASSSGLRKTSSPVSLSLSPSLSWSAVVGPGSSGDVVLPCCRVGPESM